MYKPEVAAYLSSMAYWSDFGLNKTIKLMKEDGVNFVNSIDNKKTSTQLIIAEYEGHHYIAFRGSKEREDWATNFRASKVKRPEIVGKVHLGFYESVKSVWEAIAPFINERFIICGHSLGGGLAQVLSHFVKHHFGYNLEVHAFGSAYAGDRKFANAIKYCNFYINNSDIVPRGTNIVFSNNGQRFYFNSKGDCFVRPSWWFKLIDRYSDGVGDGVDDHDIDNYYDLVEDNIGFILSKARGGY